MGRVILREFHLDRQAPYFEDYVRRYTDMPMLVRLVERDGRLVPERLLRASELAGALGQTNNPEWKTVAIDEASDAPVAPLGSIGFRWGESGRWNLEQKEGSGAPTRLRLTLAGGEVAAVDFPYFGGRAVAPFTATGHGEILSRNVPARDIATADGSRVKAATVYDLMMANYGLERGFGGGA